METRNSTLDIAKGIAIIAIVFGHVWRGLHSAGLLSGDEALYASLDRTIYMFHLTVFAFVAGLFLQRGMQRDGARKYAERRVLSFLWLYVLWTLISGVVKLATDSLVNSPTEVTTILQLWIPTAQYWFFGWITVMIIGVALLRPWQSTVRWYSTIAISAALGVATWGGLGGSVFGTQGLALTPYLALGVLLGSKRTLKLLEASRVPLVFVLTASIAIMVLLAWNELATPPTTSPLGESRTVVSVLLGIGASTMGLVGVLTLSKLLSGVPAVDKCLAYCGARSMEIFVAHTIFQAGSRIILSQLGVDSIIVHGLIGTTAGVVFPLLLAWLAYRFRVNWVFHTPRRLENIVLLERAR